MATNADGMCCASVVEASGATEVLHTDDPAEGEQFMEARRVALTALERLGTFGHAADGNLHPTIVYDATEPGAIGVLKTAYLDAQIGATERDLMRRIKTAFDPTGILNPGRAY